ncbi:MAG: hypothetical protein ABS910_07585 [Arthrobacter sp.]
MTTPDATPRSSHAGTSFRAGSLLRRGFRRAPRDGAPSGGVPPALPAGDTARRHPEAPSSLARIGGGLLSWPRFPDAVIKLALAAPPAVQPQQKAAPKAPAGPSGAEPEHVPAVSSAPAKPPAQPRPAAKTPPRPDRSPSPAAAAQHPPRISDRRTRRRAPRAVNTAVLLIVAAGLLHLVASLQAALDPLRPAPQAAVQLQELGVPADMVLSVARVADVAVAAVAFGTYLLLASLIRDGRNWARAGVCVLVAAGLFFGLRDGSFPHAAAALVTALGAGLLFLPSSASYLATHGGRTA